jgi:Holliday junction resolvasome RuvABC endonuclease subunit
MIFGVNATKEAIFIAETDGTAEQFSVINVRRIKFQIEKASDLTDLLQNISTVLDHDAHSSAASVAILKCSGGQYGSSVEAIKAEAIAELAAIQKGLTVTEVAPQSLKKALSCAAGVKWQERSKQMFNANGQHGYWSQGANGAVSAAFKAATA